MSIARTIQRTAADTLRWGDTFVFQFKGGLLSPPVSSKQLISASWRWPVIWKLMVAVRPQFASDETGTINAIFEVTPGSGGTAQPYNLPPLVLAPVAGVYSDAVAFFEIPGEALQVRCLISGTGMTSATDALIASAFVAPHNESHAATLLLDKMAGQDFEAREGDQMTHTPGFVETPPVGLYR